MFSRNRCKWLTFPCNPSWQEIKAKKSTTNALQQLISSHFIFVYSFTVFLKIYRRNRGSLSTFLAFWRKNHSDGIFMLLILRVWQHRDSTTCGHSRSKLHPDLVQKANHQPNIDDIRKSCIADNETKINVFKFAVRWHIRSLTTLKTIWTFWRSYIMFKYVCRRLSWLVQFLVFWGVLKIYSFWNILWPLSLLLCMNVNM